MARILLLKYMAKSNPRIPLVNIITQDPITGYVIDGEINGAASLYAGSTYAGIFALECMLRDVDGSGIWQMTGTVAVPAWSLMENASDQPLDTFAYNSDDTAGPLLITPAMMVNGFLDRNGTTADRTDTTPTAALLLAAMPGAAIGSYFYFYYRNISTTAGQRNTIAAGVGVTLSGGVQVISGQTQLFIGRFTDVTSAAVTLYAVNQLSGALAQVLTASGVNALIARTGATGTGASIEAVGSDTNIDIPLVPKGTGNVKVAAGAGIASSVASAFTPFKVAAAPQSISGPGAITLTQYLTEITTTGSDAFTLANGTIIGMVKKIKLIVDGGDATLTPVSLSGGTTIVFSVVGDWVELMWNGTAWVRVDDGSVLGSGATPVLA